MWRNCALVAKTAGHGIGSSKLDKHRITGTFMKALKLTLAGATFLCGAALAAHAADIYGKGASLKDTPTYMPAITWSGLYVGLHAGSTLGSELEVKGSGENFDVDESFVGGGQIGYNWQLKGPWVLGVEANYSWIDDEISDEAGNKAGFSDYLASVRGKLGYAVDRTLVYATGGVAFLGVNDDVKDALKDDTAVGYAVGGGVEHKLRDNLSLGLETLYYNTEDDLQDAPGEVERDLWTVSARLNYHFGRGGDEALK
jgi:outer membrane immunogenic protein